MVRRFARSRTHLIADYLPLADEWTVWDNASPPAVKIAAHDSHAIEEISSLLDSTRIMEPISPSEMTRLVEEASRAATEKMLDYYRRMEIKVTPQMTLASDQTRELPLPYIDPRYVS